MAGRKMGNGGQGGRPVFEHFHFGPKTDNRRFFSRILVERTNAKRISRHIHDALVHVDRLIQQDKRKLAVQHGESLIHAITDIEMQYDLAIRIALFDDRIAQRRIQFFVIVNFSIANERAVAHPQGLIGGSVESVDGQSVESHDHVHARIFQSGKFGPARRSFRKLGGEDRCNGSI